MPPFRIITVAGARPNFMKIAPILRAFSENSAFSSRLVHTGQHYDEKLSKIFFEDLKIPKPDIELGIGSGSHAIQTADIIRRFEPVLQAEQPQVVLVVGDVNSTIACALAAKKFFLEKEFSCEFGAQKRPLIVHVEAGLRSFDDDMPEEINRKLTDAISDILFVSDPIGLKHLANEGVPSNRVFFVGNVMIDTLLAARGQAEKSAVLAQLGLKEKAYGLVTLHRPSNVDDPATLKDLLKTLDQIAKKLPLVFPVHPRTRAKLAAAGIQMDAKRWVLVDPLGYIDFLKLISSASVVLTDSGGIQEETTVLGVRCITLRQNTERPVTVEEGTNILAGTDPKKVLAAFEQSTRAPKTGRIPKFWDGRSAERIDRILTKILKG